MKFGYIGMPDLHSNRISDVQLADTLGFACAYLPQTTPQDSRHKPINLNVILDATAFGRVSPSMLETQVRKANDALGGKLCLAVKMCGAEATTQDRTDAQAMETLFSDHTQSDLATTSRYPMKPPRPDILGVPTTASRQEITRAAARGYAPLTPSWLSHADVAGHWPAIVRGATSALKPARLEHWHVARTVVVHDDQAIVDEYVFGANSPIRAYYTRLVTAGIITTDVDSVLKHIVIAGSAAKVANDLMALREATGDFGTLHLITPAGSDAQITRNTMISLAENVVPLIADAQATTPKTLEST